MREAWRTPALIGAGWIALGVVAGVLESVAQGRGPLALGPALPLTGLLWVPLAFAAAALARKVPFDGDGAHDGGRGRFFLIHGLAAVAAAYVLNGAFFALALLFRAVPHETVLSATLSEGTRWLHLHVGGWAGVVFLVTWSDRARARPALDARDPHTPEPALQVPRGRGGLSVPLAEIDWIEADGDYVRLHVGEAVHLVARRMKGLEAELRGSPLVRVHRSAFVNVARVREVRHRSHGDFEAELADGTVVRVSRRRRETLLRALS